MYQRFLASLLFVFSFIVIALGGYQCAQQPLGPSTNSSPTPSGGATNTGKNAQEQVPIPSPSSSLDLDTSVDSSSSLPQAPDKDEGCSAKRDQYRDMAKRYGEMALFEFENEQVIKDYRLGAKSNFGVQCARLFLDMKAVYDPKKDTKSKKVSKTKLYGGTLRLSYEVDGRTIDVVKYSAGDSIQENINNRWDIESSWVPNVDNQVNKKEFHAIFESEHSAVILSLTNVRTRDVGDGLRAYMGGGALFYKMFRCVNSLTSKCHNEGMYIAHSRADQCDYPRKKPCWQKTAGGFSCLPNGVLPLVNVGSQVREAALPRLNIASENGRSCYKTLGYFGRLDLEEAFHVKKVKDLK